MVILFIGLFSLWLFCVARAILFLGVGTGANMESPYLYILFTPQYIVNFSLSSHAKREFTTLY